MCSTLSPREAYWLVELTDRHFGLQDAMTNPEDTDWSRINDAQAWLKETLYRASLELGENESNYLNDRAQRAAKR